MALFVSIVVCSYWSRLDDLCRTLLSIHEQTYPHREIIVVLEGAPHVKEAIEQFAFRKGVHGLRVVACPDSVGLSAARNLGVQESHGDVIAFIDDDAIPLRGWLEEIVHTYDDDSIVAVTGPALPLWEDSSLVWLPSEFSWIVGSTSGIEWEHLCDVRNVWGMNMSFRREAFETAGLFSTSIGGIKGRRLHGEEVELCLRVRRATGKRIVFNPLVKVSHKASKRRLKLPFVAKTSFWMGYTRYTIRALPSSRGEDVLALERSLLSRIFTGLLPSIARELFIHPKTAWRRLSLAIVALTTLAVGYSVAGLRNFPLLRGRRRISPSLAPKATPHE